MANRSRAECRLDVEAVAEHVMGDAVARDPHLGQLSIGFRVETLDFRLTRLALHIGRQALDKGRAQACEDGFFSALCVSGGDVSHWKPPEGP